MDPSDDEGRQEMHHLTLWRPRWLPLQMAVHESKKNLSAKIVAQRPFCDVPATRLG